MLLSSGHGAEVFTYTPRRIIAFMWFAQRRHRRELGEHMWAAAMGARGEDKAIKKQLNELLKGDGT